MSFVFFFNDTATTEIYTLSLHDALPISRRLCDRVRGGRGAGREGRRRPGGGCRRGAEERDRVPGDRLPRAASRGRHGRVRGDRKSTRLNSSHANISYAVFCLKKKTKLIK